MAVASAEHMQICILPQTDNYDNIPPLSFLQAGCPPCHSTNSVKALKYQFLCVFPVVVARSFSDNVAIRYVLTVLRTTSRFHIIGPHTQPFYVSVDFVRDNLGEPVPEGTFYHLLDHWAATDGFPHAWPILV